MRGFWMRRTTCASACSEVRTASRWRCRWKGQSLAFAASKQRFTAGLSLRPATNSTPGVPFHQLTQHNGRSPGVLAVTLSPLSVKKTVDSSRERTADALLQFAVSQP